MIILKMGGIELNDDFPCDDCPLLQWEDDCGFCSGFNKDGAYGRYIQEYYGGKDIYLRPDWCPLKEVPSYVPDRARPYAYSDDEAAAYNDGWNDCLKEIMGDDGNE